MAVTNVQFSVAVHIMAALGFRYGEETCSTALASSVNAEASFVRKSLSKLVKAGLVVATRGKHGACVLSRPPDQITLREIYRASEAPAAFAIHSYPIEMTCAISSNIKCCLTKIQSDAQQGFEEALANMTLADLIADIQGKIQCQELASPNSPQ